MIQLVPVEDRSRINLTEYSPIAARHSADIPQWIARLIALSPDLRYVMEDDTVLFVIGAVRQSFLSDQQEIWMLASKDLRPMHFKQLKRLWQEWIGTQQRATYARSDCIESDRMLEFLGFTLVDQLEDCKLYKVM